MEQKTNKKTVSHQYNDVLPIQTSIEALLPMTKTNIFNGRSGNVNNSF